MIIPKQTDKIIYFLLPLFCFTIPISTFGTTICLLSLVFLWLVTGDYGQKIKLLWVHPIARVFLLLIITSFISLLYTEADGKEAFNGLKDSLRLGATGIFIYYFTQQTPESFKHLKKRCIQAFVLAMILTMILSYLKYFFHILPHKQGLTEAAVFKNHIKTSFFMSIAVYFMASELRANPKKILLWLAILLMSGNILFLSEGRTGYLIFSILALCYFWEIAKIRGVMLMTSLLLIVLLVSQQFSLKIAERIAQIPIDLEMFSVKQDVSTSSIGARLNFIAGSRDLICEKPWFGWGIGGFREAYRTTVSDSHLYTNNPHNEYLRMAVEFGIFGLVWFVYLVVSVFRQMAKVSKKQQFLIRGIWVAFLIGCLANSWLMDFSEGMFIVIILSMFLGKVHEHNSIDYRHNVQLAPSA